MADPSKISSALTLYVGKKRDTFVSEKIDERVLRLLGLEDVFDIDYDTYLTLLKEAMVKGRMTKQTIPTDELMLLDNEYKRVKSKKGKGRFKPKKITSKDIKKGSAVGINIKQKVLPGISKKPLLALPGAGPEGGIIDDIIKELRTIVDILKSQNDLEKERQENQRKSAEDARRKTRESLLEKGTGTALKVAEKVLSPVKSFLQKIIDFITAVFLGRALIKLIRWFADKENKKKVDAIFRFLGDHWPKLLSLYILFGTGVGKFARGLSKIVIQGTRILIGAAAKLAARAGLRGAGRLGKFLLGPKGKLLGAGLELAATAGGAIALSQGIENFGGLSGGEEQKPQKYSGGGYVIPRFSGGGLNILKGAGMGSMFGPLGMLLGGAFGSGKPQQMASGFVSGEKGVDKVPAWLSDGEFVMSRGAVAKYGVDTLEAMNAAGGGTNKPKIVSGTTYAAGGGLVGDIPYYSSGQVSDNFMRKFANQYTKVLKIPEDEIYKSFKKHGVPFFNDIIGKENYNAFQGGAIDDESVKGKEILQKIRDVIKPSKEGIPRTRPQASIKRLALPAAGQSSAAMMAARTARPSIPATSAIVPYTGSGLIKTGVTGGLSTPQIPQIRTNMRVPGGFGNLKSLGVDLLLNYLMQKGFDQIEAKRIADQIEKGKGLSPEKRNAGIEKLRKLIDNEERWQRGLGGMYDKIMKMGGETISERMVRSSKAILQGLGVNSYQGGAIKGGIGLKNQAFKDMPKTQIMTDDRGRPFVGYKAMRGGKPVYIRGPQPGQGTTNPFEMLGRMINPSAYKDIDAENARKKYQEASAGNISSLKARGASQATLAKTQQRLNRSVPPPVKKSPKVVVRSPQPAGGGMGGRRGSGSNPSVPRVNPSHPSGHSRTAKVYGIK